MNSVNEIMREAVRRTAERYGKNISYMFGDWDYISDTLTTWSKSQQSSQMKFPIICLYSPYTEDRKQVVYETDLNLIIMTNTLKEYSNEAREKVSFSDCLRPIYNTFIEVLGKAHDLIETPYGFGNSVIPHLYTENYRYGRKGVKNGDGELFCDYIDAIEITNLHLKFKNNKCHAKRF